MATAEEIRIRLIAKDETKKAFDSMNKGMGRTKKAALSLRSAFAAVSAVALVGFAKRSIEAADKIGKTADKLGITTSALQEFRFAAEQSGVSTQTFDMAMQRFTRRAAEAAKGTGEAKAALQEMGIQLVDSNGNMRDSSDLLMDVADAFSGVQDKSERLRLAFKLFDSEGAALVNMLDSGKAGLQAFRTEADALGIVMDEGLIRKSEKLNDQMNIMSSVIDVKLTEAFINIAPLVDGLTEKIVALSIGYTTLMDAFFRKPEEIASLEAVKIRIDILAKERMNLKKLLKVDPSHAGWKDRIKAINEEIEKLQNRSIELSKAEGQSDILVGETTGIVGTNTAVKDTVMTFNELVRSLIKLNPQHTKAIGIFEQQEKAQKAINDTIKEYNLDAEQAAVLNELLTSSLLAMGKAGKESGEVTKTAWEEAAEAMTDSMADTITQGIRGFKTLGDVVTDIGDMIANMIIKQTIAKPIATGISNIIGDMDFGFSHSGGIVGKDTPTRVRKFHGGGIAGDEVPAILQKGEMVLTREQQKAVGNQVANITFNVQAFDSRSFQQGMVENRSIIVGVIQDAFNRNGRAVALA